MAELREERKRLAAEALQRGADEKHRHEIATMLDAFRRRCGQPDWTKEMTEYSSKARCGVGRKTKPLGGQAGLHPVAYRDPEIARRARCRLQGLYRAAFWRALGFPNCNKPH